MSCSWTFGQDSHSAVLKTHNPGQLKLRAVFERRNHQQTQRFRAFSGWSLKNDRLR